MKIQSISTHPSIERSATLLLKASIISVVSTLVIQVASNFFGFFTIPALLKPFFFTSAFTIGSITISHFVLIAASLALVSFVVRNLFATPRSPSQGSSTASSDASQSHQASQSSSSTVSTGEEPSHDSKDRHPSAVSSASASQASARAAPASDSRSSSTNPSQAAIDPAVIERAQSVREVFSRSETTPDFFSLRGPHSPFIHFMQSCNPLSRERIFAYQQAYSEENNRFFGAFCDHELELPSIKFGPDDEAFLESLHRLDHPLYQLIFDQKLSHFLIAPQLKTRRWVYVVAGPLIIAFCPNGRMSFSSCIYYADQASQSIVQIASYQIDRNYAALKPVNLLDKTITGGYTLPNLDLHRILPFDLNSFNNEPTNVASSNAPPSSHQQHLDELAQRQRQLIIHAILGNRPSLEEVKEAFKESAFES